MFEIRLTIPHNDFTYNFTTKEYIDDNNKEYYASYLNDVELCRTYSPNNVISMHYFVLSRIYTKIKTYSTKFIDKNILNNIIFSQEINTWIEQDC